MHRIVGLSVGWRTLMIDCIRMMLRNCDIVPHGV